MDVSIIIVNYHTSGLIADCLKSIFSQTIHLTYEVIIVDNNSEPDLKEKIFFPLSSDCQSKVRFLALSENIGFGRANNEGLKLATGRNILFLNPDTLLLNNAIKILSDFLDTHAEAGACGANLYDSEKKPTQSFRRWLPGIGWEFDELLNTIPQKILYGKNKSFNHSRQPLEVGFILGADLMVKRKVIGETGAFSPVFFMYFEETDLCFRIKKAGWKIYNVPDAEIIHLEGKSLPETTGIQSDFKTEKLEESRKKYYLNNKSALHRMAADFIYSLFLLTRKNLIRNKVKSEYYSRRLHYFKNTH